nr:ATP-binding cassette domain-containing protein [Leucobacter insecticola]
MPNSVINVQDVHKTYIIGEKPSLWQRLFGRKDTRRSLEVLKGVNLEVAPGETVVLIGSSGSGKSTLLRCINKLEVIESGRILVNDHLVGYREIEGKLVGESARATAAKRTDIGMVFQHFNLFMNKTALENVMALCGTSRNSRARQRKNWPSQRSIWWDCRIACTTTRLAFPADRSSALPSPGHLQCSPV